MCRRWLVGWGREIWPKVSALLTGPSLLPRYHLHTPFSIPINTSHSSQSFTPFTNTTKTKLFQTKTTMEIATTLTAALHHVAANFPSHRALSVASKFDLTHSRLHQLAESAAQRLLLAGIKPGDVVALTFPNTVEVRPPKPLHCSQLYYIT